MRKVEGKEGPSNGQLVRRLLGLAWEYRLGCIKLLALQLSAVALLPVGLGMTGLAIDVVRHAQNPATPKPHYPFGWQPPVSWSPLQVVSLLAGFVFVCALVRGAISFRLAVSRTKLVQGQVVVKLRSMVYDKLQRLSFRFFDQNSTGSVINRVTGDVQLVRQFIDGVVLQLVVVFASLLFYLAYMLSIHVLLTLACLATTPLLWVASVWFSRLVRPAYDHNRELFDRMVLSLAESVQGVHVVKGFAREEDAIRRFGKANSDFRHQQDWIFRTVSYYSPTVGFLTQLNLVILLGYGGYLAMHHELAIGTGLVVFAGLLQQFANQITSFADIANSIQQSLTGARRVFEILDAPLEISSPPNAIPLPKAQGHLRFEDVSFRYQDGPVVLDSVILDVPAGQCVALVGATGAGKTTLLSLIPRFYDPIQGRLLLDGHDLRQLDLRDLRKNIGIVFQESFLFSTTVAENIAFGYPEATREQIEKAAEIAAAADFIRDLPQGYDTVLGEAGVDLSGGQRQRLAIARAILLEPSILLLDDPTAAIDPQTEHEIMEAMQHAMEGRTTFVIAHRLSTLRRADTVIVLERGRIVQRGTHAELMKESGHYREAAHLQTSHTHDLPHSPLSGPWHTPADNLRP